MPRFKLMGLLLITVTTPAILAQGGEIPKEKSFKWKGPEFSQEQKEAQRIQMELKRQKGPLAQDLQSFVTTYESAQRSFVESVKKSSNYTEIAEKIREEEAQRIQMELKHQKELAQDLKSFVTTYEGAQKSFVTSVKNSSSYTKIAEKIRAEEEQRKKQIKQEGEKEGFFSRLFGKKKSDSQQPVTQSMPRQEVVE